MAVTKSHVQWTHQWDGIASLNSYYIIIRNLKTIPHPTVVYYWHKIRYVKINCLVSAVLQYSIGNSVSKEKSLCAYICVWEREREKQRQSFMSFGFPGDFLCSCELSFEGSGISPLSIEVVVTVIFLQSLCVRIYTYVTAQEITILALVHFVISIIIMYIA